MLDQNSIRTLEIKPFRSTSNDVSGLVIGADVHEELNRVNPASGIFRNLRICCFGNFGLFREVVY